MSSRYEPLECASRAVEVLGGLCNGEKSRPSRPMKGVLCRFVSHDGSKMGVRAQSGKPDHFHPGLSRVGREIICGARLCEPWEALWNPESLEEAKVPAALALITGVQMTLSSYGIGGTVHKAAAVEIHLIRLISVREVRFSRGGLRRAKSAQLSSAEPPLSVCTGWPLLPGSFGRSVNTIDGPKWVLEPPGCCRIFVDTSQTQRRPFRVWCDDCVEAHRTRSMPRTAERTVARIFAEAHRGRSGLPD